MLWTSSSREAHPLAWQAYARTFPYPVVLERAMLPAALFSEQEEASRAAAASNQRRLPVVWLRRIWFSIEMMDRGPMAPLSPAEWHDLARLVLVPFEWTVAQGATAAALEVKLKRRATLTLFGLLGRCITWPPPAVAGEEDLHAVTRALLMRVVAADWASAELFAGHEEARYYCTLFGDTHLDMMVALCGHGRLGPDQEVWFQGGMDSILTRSYPLPHRVLCAGELPDLVPYLIHADLIYEKGKMKKPKSLPLITQLVHIFLCKVMNQVRGHVTLSMSLFSLSTHLRPMVLRVLSIAAPT